jgi:hypothetical protein
MGIGDRSVDFYFFQTNFKYLNNTESEEEYFQQLLYVCFLKKLPCFTGGRSRSRIRIKIITPRHQNDGTPQHWFLLNARPGLCV